MKNDLWPREIAGVAQGIGSFAKCSGARCSEWTFARYGERALCLAHALKAWREAVAA